MSLEPWVVNVILVLATLVWVGNFLAAVFRKDYQMSETINAVMLALIGGLFAMRKTKHDKDKGDNKGDDD